MPIFVPAQCTEREPGGWEDCTWCTGVMLNNAVHGANVRPSTREEYEALRVAGGDGPRENPGDGSNHQQLVDGIRRRYGWTPSRLGPPGSTQPAWSVVMSHLDTPGDVVALQGSMGVWGPSSHWRRWDTGFSGPHDVLVIRRDNYSRVWWMNPQAPNSYPGEWMSLLDARRYYEGFRGGILFDRVGRLAPPPARYRVQVAQGATIRTYKLGSTGSPRCIAEVVSDYRWPGPASGAPASVGVRRQTCDGTSSATTTLVTGGMFAGKHIQVGTNGVTLVKA